MSCTICVRLVPVRRTFEDRPGLALLLGAANRQGLILPGVTIGDGCIIGAGAVVSRDIPPYSVAVGVPARVVRKRKEAGAEL